MSDNALNVPEEFRESLDEQSARSLPGRGVLEVLLILALFFVTHGDLPPDVNEGHYLGKAKHYWNPAWCPEDHFLNVGQGWEEYLTRKCTSYSPGFDSQ